MGSYCLLDSNQNIESELPNNNNSVKCFCCKNTSSTAIHSCFTISKNIPQKDPQSFSNIPLTNQNAVSSSITNLNNFNPLPKNYKQITTTKLTTDDLSELFEYYPPLNDNIIVELRPPMQSNDKTIYYGEWDKQTNFRHGRGIKIWQDNSKYEGYWAHDKANGKGKLTHYDGDIYEGEWVDDKPNGKGCYIHKDGTKYEGGWKNDKQEGDGMEFWPDGSVYVGNYKNGKKHGFGKFKWSDGSSYEGNFDNNNINGKGKYVFCDKRVYVGDWVNNKIEGYGTFNWPDGRKYVGEYKNDKKEGFGEYEWNKGKKYKGFWKNGKQHGEGCIFLPKNQCWKRGLWENGKRVRWLDENE